MPELLIRFTAPLAISPAAPPAAPARAIPAAPPPDTWPVIGATKRSNAGSAINAMSIKARPVMIDQIPPPSPANASVPMRLNAAA